MRNLLLSACLLLTSPLAVSASDFVTLGDNFKQFANTYCVSCHGPDEQNGEFRIDQLDDSLRNTALARDWQDVLDVLNLGEMPPKEAKQRPTTEELSAAIDELTLAIREARHRFADTGGRPIIRRLNKRELKIILEELLAVDVNVDILADDDEMDGFDTVGSSLTTSSMHLEKVAEVARASLELVQPLKVQTPSKLIKNDFSGSVEDVQNRADGYKKVKLTRRKPVGYAYLWHARSRYPEAVPTGNIVLPGYNDYHYLPNTQTKTPGKYKIRMRVAALGTPDPYGEFIYLHSDFRIGPVATGGNTRPLHVTAGFDNPQVVEVEIDHHENYSGTQAILVQMRYARRTPRRDIHEIMGVKGWKKILTNDYESAIWVDYIEIEGPLAEERRDPHGEIFFEGLADSSP